MKRNIKHQMKSQSEKATYCLSPSLQHSGEGRTMETVSRQVATRVRGWERVWTGRAQRIFRAVKLLCMMLQWWTHVLHICPNPQNIYVYTCYCCSGAQSCPTLYKPTDCSPPGSSVHVIVQARILEWAAFPSPGDHQIRISCLAGRFFTAEPPGSSCVYIHIPI